MKDEIPSSALPTLPSNTRLAIVRSAWHDTLTQSMEEDAKRILNEAGVTDIITLVIPGAFEIPLACQKIIRERNVAGVIALGVIVQGETHHAGEIARACTDGLMQVMLETGVPIAHGVLFTDTLKAAEERALGRENKGTEVAATLVRMLVSR